jgi:hypothetical protein
MRMETKVDEECAATRSNAQAPLLRLPGGMWLSRLAAISRGLVLKLIRKIAQSHLRLRV